MFVLPCSRDKLFDFIPAEIGVAQGGFSATGVIEAVDACCIFKIIIAGSIAHSVA